MTIEVALTWIVMAAGFLSMAVNLRAWSRRPHRSRRGLYILSAVISFCFGAVYLLVVLEVVNLDLLAESVMLRWLAILALLVLLLHGLVDI